jgi:hypothetical protein
MGKSDSEKKKERKRKGNSDGQDTVLLAHLSSGLVSFSPLEEVLKGVYRFRVSDDGPALDLKYRRNVFKD